MLMFTLTFFAADYSFAKTHHKKTAVHKTKKAVKKKHSASHKPAKKSKVASVGKKKKNRQVASVDDGPHWARSGDKKAKKSNKRGAKYNRY